MTPSMLRDAEQNGASVGEMPDMDPGAAYWASMWSTLRASTPSDQPISIQALALVTTDEAEFHQALPLMQGMDRVLFEWQRERRDAERKRAEAKAKSKQRAKGRSR